MSVNELEARVIKMQEWEALAEEAKAEADTLNQEYVEDELLKEKGDMV